MQTWCLLTHFDGMLEKTLPPWKKLIPLFRMGDFTTRSLQLLRLALLVYYVHHSPTSKNPNFLILWSPFILTTHFPRKSIKALLMWWIHKWWWVSWLSSNVFKGSTATYSCYVLRQNIVYRNPKNVWGLAQICRNINYISGIVNTIQGFEGKH